MLTLCKDLFCTWRYKNKVMEMDLVWNSNSDSCVKFDKYSFSLNGQRILLITISINSFETFYFMHIFFCSNILKWNILQGVQSPNNIF